MASTSSYIQISDYALLEYIYANESISTSQVKPLRLFNNYSNEYLFLNNAQATGITANVLDYSAVRLGRESTKWGYLDMDTVTPLVQIDPNLTLTDLTSLLTPVVKYDKVRLHFLSGYDFPGIDGVVMQLSWNEWELSGTGGKNFIAASQVYLKSEQRLEFSVNPLFVGDRLYDKYIEFSLPSLADANFDFWNSPTANNTLGYNYTFNNVGFSQESQITAKMFEINTTQTERGNQYFITGESFTTSFNPADLYSYISAVVQENPENDFIEYYPTWNGQFLEDYINLLNAGGGNWVVVNQIEVSEQIGTSFVNTFSMTSLQDNNLDAPAVFRPIIRNATVASAFTVVYDMRLMNKSNGQEIIRRATWTSTNPKKYGMKLERINVLEGFRPVKVYNKVVNLSEDSLKTSVQYLGSSQVSTQNVYVNSYYDVNYISVDSTTSLSSVLGETVYPQGENIIFINRFDNYVKFKIFTKSANKQQNVSLDLAGGGMNIKLAFIYDDQSKIYLDPVQDMKNADPGAGEILFRIDDSISTKLLSGKQREYYIVNKNDMGDEVLIYSGKFENQSNRKSVMASMSQIILDQLDSKINALKNAQASFNATASFAAGNEIETSSANSALAMSQQDEIAAAQESQAFVQSVAGGILAAIQNAAASGNIQQLNIPEVPGVTPFMGANINNALTPNVVRPSEPGTQLSAQSVSSSALQK